MDIDFYGLDAKETLTLNRKQIKKEARNKISEISDLAVQFYFTEIEESLLMEKEGRNDEEINQIYTYWCTFSLPKKLELLSTYKNTFEKVNKCVNVLEKNSENGFIERKINFKEVMVRLNQTLIISNLDDYTQYGYDSIRLSVDTIKQIVNKNKVPFPMIVVDKNFTEQLNCSFFEKIIFIPEGKGLLMGLPTSEKIKLPIAVDKKTNKYLVKQLLKPSKLQGLYIFGRVSTRRYTIATKEYEPICTSQVPFGISGMIHESTSYIISPVTIKQWETNKNLEENKFVEMICSCKEFLNLVDYVYEHQLEAGKYMKQKIKEEYERLIREQYRIMKEDESENEAKNEHEKDAESHGEKERDKEN